MKHPKLRDSKRLLTNELYSIGDIPQEYIVKIGGHVVYLIHSGRKDMTGDDWGDIFADVIGGKHLASPVGIADVEYGKMAWSMKTVKISNVFDCENIRLISGRCSPDFSFGITDPHENIQRTGEAVQSAGGLPHLHSGTAGGTDAVSVPKRQSRHEPDSAL